MHAVYRAAAKAAAGHASGDHGAVRRPASAVQGLKLKPSASGRQRSEATTLQPAAPAARQAESHCPHFKDCPGCAVPDAVAPLPPLLQEARAFFERQGFTDFQSSFGALHGWRCRARLACRPDASGQPAIGLFQEGTHDLLPIPECMAHHPLINRVALLVQAAARAEGVAPYDERTGAGELRYVSLTLAAASPPSASPSHGDGSTAGARHQQRQGGGGELAVQVALVWNAAGPQQAARGGRLQALAGRLWRVGGPLLHSVWANYNSARHNVIHGPEWELLRGSEWGWARLGGADVCFGPGSFMQANYGAMDACLSAIQRAVPKGAGVVDLHAGVGTIGLSLAASRAPRWVRFVESNPLAELPFHQSAALLRGRSSGGSEAGGPGPGLEYIVALAGAQPARWCAGADVVVVDPPRKGLEPDLLAYLCQPGGQHAQQQHREAGSRGPARLVYLSCGFPGLARDCAALLASGRWALASAQAFVFFPGANQIETLAVFDRVGL